MCHGASLGTDAPSKQQPRDFFCPPQALKSFASAPGRESLDIITSNYFHILNFAPISLNKKCSNICMKSLTRQEGVHVCWSQYLSRVIKEISKKDRPIFVPLKTPVSQVLQKYCLLTKRRSHFLPLKTSVNHRYYRDRPILRNGVI